MTAQLQHAKLTLEAYHKHEKLVNAKMLKTKIRANGLNFHGCGYMCVLCTARNYAHIW